MLTLIVDALVQFFFLYRIWRCEFPIFLLGFDINIFANNPPIPAIMLLIHSQPW